jgi:phosphoribosyl 1,2-cyclic phosphodiesterase
MARGDEKLLFVIDTNYIPFRFSGLTHIMIGVNFSLEILRENVTAGTVDIERAKRTIKNHMSLETAKAFFEANDMSSVREIHLLHLSSQNADADSFKSRIERVTGKPVYVANC